MRHIRGANRQQTTLLPESLDEFVPADHPVRVIDAYVDSLDTKALGFDKAVTKETGRKPYHPGDLLKLYVYGYLNRVSSSRRLETECHRNLEVLWLMKRLRPDFKTIADFRKDNGEAIRGACRSFIQFCRQSQLLSGQKVAIDGSKFRAAASIDQALTRSQLEAQRARIEQKIERYLAQLDEADSEDGPVELERDHIGQALEQLKAKAQHLQEREVEMDCMQRDQHCATESDAKLLRSGREGTILGYNVQTAVDADTGLIVHHEVTDDSSDSRQLLPMAEQAKAELGADVLEVLADKGYSNGEHLQACDEQGITATVARPQIPSSNPQMYQKQDFVYDEERDQYRCPAGNVLHHSSDDHAKKKHRYRRSGCDQCPLQANCTRSDTRTITRHFYEAALERSQARVQGDPSAMGQRMAIVERPFAQLKQAMALRRFNCKGMTGAKTEMAIAVLGYNLNRMISRLGVPRMLEMIA